MSAYVHISFHRTVTRVAPHVRYIADRPESRGLRGLGPEFRALHGDVARSIALLQEHAGIVRTRTGDGLRDGPFVRMVFTLPDDLARRVMRADACLDKGGERVVRDAIESTFRSAARHLQGVYAIHFHAVQREAHPHAHVDLSPLDLHGRTVFLTGQQRDTLRSTWEREVERALERVERRQRPDPVPEVLREHIGRERAPAPPSRRAKAVRGRSVVGDVGRDMRHAGSPSGELVRVTPERPALADARAAAGPTSRDTRMSPGQPGRPADAVARGASRSDSAPDPRQTTLPAARGRRESLANVWRPPDGPFEDARQDHGRERPVDAGAHPRGPSVVAPEDTSGGHGRPREPGAAAPHGRARVEAPATPGPAHDGSKRGRSVGEELGYDASTPGPVPGVRARGEDERAGELPRSDAGPRPIAWRVGRHATREATLPSEYEAGARERPIEASPARPGARHDDKPAPTGRGQLLTTGVGSRPTGPRRQRGPRPSYLSVALDRLLATSGSPLLDLLGRALLARVDARLGLPSPSRAVRAVLGLPVRLPSDLTPEIPWPIRQLWSRDR